MCHWSEQVTAPPQNQADNLVEERKEISGVTLPVFDDIAALVADALMRIQIDDVKLFFGVDGSKMRLDGPSMRQVPTLLLLHGGPGFDHSGFKPAFNEMADVTQEVYLDLRGKGRSDEGPANNPFARRCQSNIQLCWAIRWAVS